MSHLTVIEPAAVCAAHNPVVVTLSTDTKTTPVNAVNRFTVNALLHNNDSLQVTLSADLNNYQAKFWAKDFPNADNYFLTGTIKNATGGTVTATTTSWIASSLAGALLSDLVISKNYFINSSANTVTLVSRQQSSRFNITSGQIMTLNPSGVPTSTGITHTVVSSGADAFVGSTITDASYFVDVYGDLYSGENGGVGYVYNQSVNKSKLQRITGLELPYDSSNEMKFDFSNVVKSYLNTKAVLETIEKPFGQQNHYNYIRPFYFTYGENSPLVIGTTTRKKIQKGQTDIKWICNAGLDYFEKNNMSGFTSISGSTIAKFLTNSPSSKKSYPESKEILSILFPISVTGGYTMIVDIIYWDGSTRSFTVGVGIDGGMVTLDVSHGLYLLPFETSTKKTKQVDFRLVYAISNVPFTETKTFRYDYGLTLDLFHVAFMNRLGTFDTFSFQGLRTDEPDRSYSTISNPVQPNSDGSYDKGFKSSTAFDVRLTKRITVDSGWISESEFNWLQELLNSNLIYSYSNGAVDNYLKLDTIKAPKTNQDKQFNFGVSFVQTIVENNVSF